MDEIDRRIIQALRGDGRISNADLAAAVGLSASACHRRVRLLEESGTIRGYTALIGGAAVTLVGVASAYRTSILGVADAVATNIFLLGGALGISIFVGWRMEDPIDAASEGAAGVGVYRAWLMLLRFVVPVALVFILWHSVPSAWGAILEVLGG